MREDGGETTVTAATLTRAASLVGPTVVAVGDIACEPGEEITGTQCRQAATAQLASTFAPRYVLALGDLQYRTGALSDYLGSYDESWGALKPITKPVPGNHEYGTPGASGYYTYFADQQPGPPGYYAFNIGSWRIYALNSNCDQVDCARQVRWLNRNMTRYPRRCSAIMMHHPRFSSGREHGSDPTMNLFWDVAYRHRADIALAGHDHTYERFMKLTPSAAYSRHGILSFVSGAGGRSLYAFGPTETGSVARDSHTSGVLALTLGTNRYSWQYKTIDGKVMDAGVRRCR